MTMSPNEAKQALEMIWARLLSAKDANFLMGCSCGAGRRIVCFYYKFHLKSLRYLR